MIDPSQVLVRQADSGSDRIVEFPQKFPRSPLRYPGGKNRAVKAITKLIFAQIPSDEKKLCSPFLGGGSIELACTTKMEVYGADIFEPLVAFWRVLLRDPEMLARRVEPYLHSLTRTQFYNLQKRFIHLTDEVERAAAFFVLNRSSFSGTTLSGGMSPGHPRFTQSAIERIKSFKVDNFHVENADYREVIPKHEDAFLYLDPPYLNGQGLYGVKGDTHKSFDHEALADLLHKRDRWIMSYNDCPEVRELYKDKTIVSIEWIYGMSKNKQSKEVLIASPDVNLAA
ncbi:MAG TPA: DNA adenine methylase [Pyrinomonadaceae bacterium]|jgi:DNA adenine methylase